MQGKDNRRNGLSQYNERRTKKKKQYVSNIVYILQAIIKSVG